jgi:DNA repair protein RecO (recombination protein O)
MINAAQLQPAYILHTRPYRDSSLLIEAFTLAQGRISLVAKAGRGLSHRKSRFKGLLQAFIPLLLSWRGKTELLNLSGAEPQGLFSPPLTGKLLICGLYLNELLMRLLFRYDPHPLLFQAYQHTLATLANHHHPNLALRLFEKTLLAELGYALHLNQESQTQQAVIADQRYQFIPSQGIVVCFNALPKASIFSGSSLLAIHHEQWTSPHQLSDAKRLFRLALAHLLEGKRIRSRELFSVSTNSMDSSNALEILTKN